MQHNPRFWFVPCWSGDFRLARDPDKPEDRCVLTVENPTKGDQKKLGTFLTAARADGWLHASAGVSPTGTTRLVLDVPLRIAGPLLAKKAQGDTATWTGVRYASGKVEVYDGTELPPEAGELPAVKGKGAIERATDAVSSAGTALVKAGKDAIEAVVTVKRPALGCPPPVACNRRASQVLSIFSTAEQLDDLKRHGRMRVVGNATGDAYWLYHRDEAARQGLGHVLVAASNGWETCVWDDTVPAEEELLAVKFAVEHREAWLNGLTLDVEAIRAGL